jgi:ribosome-associated translation inhibitor RaiA
MQTSVTFKNLDPTDTLKSYVRDKLDRFDRLIDLIVYLITLPRPMWSYWLRNSAI